MTKPRCRRRALGLLVVASLGIALRAKAAELPLVLSEDFESGSSRWQPTDGGSWEVIDTPRGKGFSLFQQSKYQPPHRSPVNITILKDVIVSDFVLDVDLQSTVKDYDQRMLVLVFGYHDTA